MSVYSISQSGMMCLSDGVCVHLRQNHVLHGRLLQRKIARNKTVKEFVKEVVLMVAMGLMATTGI